MAENSVRVFVSSDSRNAALVVLAYSFHRLWVCPSESESFVGSMNKDKTYSVIHSLLFFLTVQITRRNSGTIQIC